jgi:hypothetical protein
MGFTSNLKLAIYLSQPPAYAGIFVPVSHTESLTLSDTVLLAKVAWQSQGLDLLCLLKVSSLSSLPLMVSHKSSSSTTFSDSKPKNSQ